MEENKVSFREVWKKYERDNNFLIKTINILYKEGGYPRGLTCRAEVVPPWTWWFHKKEQKKIEKKTDNIIEIHVRFY